MDGGNISPGGKKNIPITPWPFFTVLISVEEIVLVEASTLFFLDYKVGKHSVHSAFISFLPRQ